MLGALKQKICPSKQLTNNFPLLFNCIMQLILPLNPSKGLAQAAAVKLLENGEKSPERVDVVGF